MDTNNIGTVEYIDNSHNEDEYRIGERFEYRAGELCSVEGQEEFDAVIAQCIKEGLLGLSPEEIHALFESAEKKMQDWRQNYYEGQKPSTASETV